MIYHVRASEDIGKHPQSFQSVVEAGVFGANSAMNQGVQVGY